MFNVKYGILRLEINLLRKFPETQFPKDSSDSSSFLLVHLVLSILVVFAPSLLHIFSGEWFLFCFIQIRTVPRYNYRHNFFLRFFLSDVAFFSFFYFVFFLLSPFQKKSGYNLRYQSRHMCTSNMCNDVRIRFPSHIKHLTLLIFFSLSSYTFTPYTSSMIRIHDSPDFLIFV